MHAGDRKAFDRFFSAHSARVLVYINYNMGPRLRRKVDPSDILQNLYLKLFKNFASFLERVERLGIRNALIRMADHEITEAYRFHFKVSKRDARREVTGHYLGADEKDGMSPLDWVPADATSVTARVAREEEYQQVMKALSELTPLEQFVTVARVIEGVPAQEIAERIGKSRGAVQMMIARARDKLRERARPRTRGGET
jgi:RNA polymerase sigma-70 factor (ECF subfamily)